MDTPFFNKELESSKSEFSGLYLTEVVGRSKDFWSSSVQLSDRKAADYHTEITRLHHDVLKFAETYQFELPAIHYQHNPNQDMVRSLRTHAHADGDLEIEFDFENLNDHFADTERDIIVENLTFLSRGWIAKEDKLIFLRGLAANWTWRHLDKTLIRKRLGVLVNYPEFHDQVEKAEWLSIFQNSGACLFDSLAAGIVGDMVESIPKNEMIDFIHTGLNLDHSWVPFHLLRSAFQLGSSIEIRASKLALSPPAIKPNDVSIAELRLRLLSYEVDLKQIFPKVYQPTYRINNLKNEHLNVRVHFYEHDSPGRLTDIKRMLTNTLTTENTSEYTPELLILHGERFSTTLSWYSKDLECRVNSPWHYVEL